MIFGERRTVEDFMEKDVTERIARTRHKHYEDKRKGKVNFIEDTIKQGTLYQLKETFPNFEKGPVNMHRTSRSAQPHAAVGKIQHHNTYG